MTYFFTADEHYGHKNVIEYNKRPFKNIDEMNEALIRNHNEVVEPDDTTVHVGDFSMIHNRERVEAIIHRLNGDHIFIKGSHDYWLEKPGISLDYGPEIQVWEKEIKTDLGLFYIVACHYAMRTWPRSHHGAWQLYGHSHGNLPGIGPQMDVGVDTNNFYPYSLEDIVKILRNRPILKANRKHEKNMRRMYGI